MSKKIKYHIEINGERYHNCGRSTFESHLRFAKEHDLEWVVNRYLNGHWAHDHYVLTIIG